MLTGENGILTQAQNAKEETEEARIEEENRISDYEDYISQYANGGYVESKGVNAPVLKDNMELVTYNEETGEWEENNSSSAYDYVAEEDSEDNNKSKWANAVVTVDGVDSYFVWIPRYAYKITYNDVNNKSAGGTIDVKFLVGTSDNYYDENGELKEAKRAETGHEDTTSDYYVHPTFTNNVDLGGWDSELTGIWVGKYETSLVNKESKENIITTETGDTAGDILLSENTDKAIAVQPGVSSWRYCTIGTAYTNAKSYAEELNSHMLKNSEWGAVAYLAYSQYGRNGYAISVNQNSEYITANGKNIFESAGQSTTGNVTGIYDLAGCCYEYASSYFLDGNFLVETTFTKKISDAFSTCYKISEGIVGDATDETFRWGEDSAYIIDTNLPFVCRGGGYDNVSDAGLFCYFNGRGSAYDRASFRICLIG